MKKLFSTIALIVLSLFVCLNLIACTNHNDDKCDVCGDEAYTKLNGDGCEYCYDCYLDAINYYLK